MTIYQTIEGNINSFLEKGRAIAINNVYVYKIQAVFKGGIRSLISSELKVKY